jgi:hypothetical protein
MIVVVLGTLGAISFFASCALHQYLAATSPSYAIASSEQVYQLSNHGRLFYVTRGEYWSFYISFSGGLLLLIAACLNWRWKVVKNLTPGGWRYPT